MKRTSLEQSLRDALLHLYDPSYKPDEIFCEVLNPQDCHHGKAWIDSLRQAIVEMEPGEDVPANARSWRFYHILDYRYVQRLTQEETAGHLGITPRHLRREQQEAIKTLAQQLWNRRPVQQTPGNLSGVGADGEPENAWLQQMREEVATLRRNAPAIVSPLGEVIAGIQPLAEVLAAQHAIQFHATEPVADVMAALHPTILRQLLLTAIEMLVQHMDGGEIFLETETSGDFIGIFFRASNSCRPIDLTSEFIQELMDDIGGQFIIESNQTETVIRMFVPGVRKMQVLVVDDNADLVHLYQRYVARTRFEIASLSSGLELFPTIEAIRPDIIVLDVMLPDMDGWELLTYLHTHPDTRDIPVIVCSVIRRKELARALGASYYLAKPVRRQAFIEALELTARRQGEEALWIETESSSSIV
jgi:CheY-like chemotaxis protein